MPIIVSDTSPIRALSHLGLLDLLHTQFERVLIPPAVAAEIARGSPSFLPIDLSARHYIVTADPINADPIIGAEPDLDRGEAEAIALALCEGVDVILIDEAAGRAAAARRRLRTVGALGVLIEQKRHDAAFAVRPYMDRLRNEINFFIDDRLYQHVCAVVGE